MNYNQTIDYLYRQLPVFHRIGAAAYKANLDNTLIMDNLYNHPHRNYKTIHIAGTNGKGSVSHSMASVLQSAGYKTGLYTSPHLKDFRERIRINGKMISKKEVTKWVKNFVINNEMWKISPSFFELSVIMAFDIFAKNAVDVAVIETGLGGRLDSTNIITPELAIVTNIGYDHVAILGDTLEKIGFEKAGIIKKGVPVVIGKTQTETENVFLEKAWKEGTEIFFADKEYHIEYSTFDLSLNQIFHLTKNSKRVYEGLKSDLQGEYQKENICTLLKAIDVLQKRGWEIPLEAIYEGIANVSLQTGLMGRWQRLGSNPAIICDTGHNPDGIAYVMRQVENTPYEHLHVVFGMVNDKDPDPVLQLLPKNAEYYFTKANLPRALDEKVLSKRAHELGLKGENYSSVKKAFKAAKMKAGPNDLIFVGGSTFIVAEVL